MPNCFYGNKGTIHLIYTSKLEGNLVHRMDVMIWTKHTVRLYEHKYLDFFFRLYFFFSSSNKIFLVQINYFNDRSKHEVS